MAGHTHAPIAPLHRTLDQELVALLRGASLECLVCGEFVMHARGGSVFCPECGSQLADADAVETDLSAGVECTLQAG
jgi:ribosomal protein S27E